MIQILVRMAMEPSDNFPEGNISGLRYQPSDLGINSGRFSALEEMLLSYLPNR